MGCEHRLRHHSDVTWLGLSFHGKGLAEQIGNGSKISITISSKARAPCPRLTCPLSLRWFPEQGDVVRTPGKPYQRSPGFIKAAVSLGWEGRREVGVHSVFELQSRGPEY